METILTKQYEEAPLDFTSFSETALHDFYIGHACRQAAILCRKEVLSGKANFGIAGDGKELCQIALAKVFRNGDWRSGYYRDLALHVSTGICSIRHFFAQLYAHSDSDFEPMSKGRQMNSHFGKPFIDREGNWLDQTQTKNSFPDNSTTGGQMARSLGLALASKLHQQIKDVPHAEKFSKDGKEIVFVTVGNGTTSEGVFWETVNAAGVLKVPLVISILDDGFGISVENELQTTKGDIFEALKGFQRDSLGEGIELIKVKGWDYPSLVKAYIEAERIARENQTPIIIHVDELTQQLGHSSSGSHERYKTKERLEWEREFDCLVQMEKWLIENEISTESELERIKESAINFANSEKEESWKNYRKHIEERLLLFENSINNSVGFLSPEFETLARQQLTELQSNKNNIKIKDIHSAARLIFLSHREEVKIKETDFWKWYAQSNAEIDDKYHSNTYISDSTSHVHVPACPPVITDDSKVVDGKTVAQKCFDINLGRYPNLLAFGEDIGKLGGVNKCFAGLQKKYGPLRVRDTGIREATIVGEAIGLSTRGFRPIVEIQYLDYIYFPLYIIADDLSTVHYRSGGGGKCPVIVRTRGHRLEGIWHSGSPLGAIINSVRGMVVCVPRNFVQASGMYNTLLQCEDPALVIEPLLGYRLKEKMPENMEELSVPFGVVEVLEEGTDITVVSYGTCIRFIQKAIPKLKQLNINIELIDVQTLLPFDTAHDIRKSIQKTNKVLFIDEDVPGGASAYMMQKVLEEQGAFQFLDSAPKTLTAYEHRSPYGEDGNYFTKPSTDDVVEKVYKMMHEYDEKTYPLAFPEIFK